LVAITGHETVAMAKKTWKSEKPVFRRVFASPEYPIATAG
jgi:hypothetical protein